jgi:hypothetical protein
MNPDRIERQKKFLAIAAAHAEDFKTRVAQHDRENSFAHENVAAMKASGYTIILANQPSVPCRPFAFATQSLLAV